MTKKAKAEQISAVLDNLGAYASLDIVGFILAELEAAGMQWDQEELQLDSFASGSGFHRIVSTASGAMHPFTKAEAQEIIRRYEAIEHAKALVKEALGVYGTRGEDYARLKKLEAVLDGKEGA